MWYVRSILASALILMGVGCNQMTIEGASASKVSVIAPAEMLAGHCARWEISFVNKSGDVAKTGDGIALNLSLTSGGVPVEGEIFANSSCSTPITQINVGKGTTGLSVYVRYNLIKNISLNVTADGVTSGSASVATGLRLSQVTFAAGGRDSWGYYPATGTSARINGIMGMATDGVYIYTSNYWNHIVMKIKISTKEVSFVAGKVDNYGYADGIGANAQFAYPYGMTYLNGKLYVADWWNNVLREIDLSNNMVTTVVGQAGNRQWNDGDGTAAGLSVFYGVTTDGTDLYITDTNSDLIRKVEPTNNFRVTTLAGQLVQNGGDDGVGALAKFHFPALPATDGTFLYIPDYGGHTIRQLEFATNNVTTIAGSYGVSGFVDDVGTAARFNGIHSLKYEAGFLYIADTGNNAVRKMELSSGAVTTIAGDPGSAEDIDGSFATSRFNGPRDLLKIGNKIYVGGYNSTTLRELDLTSQTSRTVVGLAVNDAWSTRDGVGSDARINWDDSAIAGPDYLYFGDWNGNVIRRMSYTTFEVETIAGSGVAGAADGVGVLASFKNPLGLALSGNTLYVSEESNVIRKIDLLTNTVTTIAGLSGAPGATTDGAGALARFNKPTSLVLNGTDLYVTEMNGNCIRKIDLANNNDVTTVAGTAGASGIADGMGAAASFVKLQSAVILGGYMYLTDNNAHTIRKMDLSNYDVTTLAGLGNTAGYVDDTGSAARFNYPYQITTDGVSLYVADQSNHAIRKVNPTTGEVTTLAGRPQGSNYYADRDSDLANATLTWPSSLVWTPQGFYWSNNGLNFSWLH